MLFIEFTDVDGEKLLVNPRQVIFVEPCEYEGEPKEEKLFDPLLHGYHRRMKIEKYKGTKIHFIGNYGWRIVKESYEKVRSALREEINIVYEKSIPTAEDVLGVKI